MNRCPSWSVALAVGLVTAATVARAQSDNAAGVNSNDPRSTLHAGWLDAGEAAHNLELIAHRTRPDNFVNPQNSSDFAFINADIAFKGTLLVQGGYNGLQVWDISNPTNPTLRTSVVCPGGQGDVSLYRNLLFMSVEDTRGRIDCGTQGVKDSVSAERFRGVRIFDVSDVDHPKQVAHVQTCRGSHTHTLVLDPNDAANAYIYVQGTGPVRPGAELAGCSADTTDVSANSSRFRIEVIKVPLAAPQQAKVVATPRIFADATTGAVNGLWKGGDHGDGTQNTGETDQCHDITAYTAIGLAAGACSGNGILLDIRHPAHPKRVAEISDPNFAYWHSATFSNDGKKVIFTDEWGGGIGARCRSTDKLTWGADAIFTLAADRKMQLAGYFKMPAPQPDTKNCVAHNGSLVPVPGRDIAVQAWYQGGVSVFDFSDPAHAVEIAYFDRGPVDSTKLTLSGYWSAYWYNGHIYGSEISRGLDVFDLKPSEFLSQNEIDAAKSVHVDLLNVQNQQRIIWPANIAVARAYLDQLVRKNGIASEQSTRIAGDLDQAEHLTGTQRKAAFAKLASEISSQAAGAADPDRVRALAAAVKRLAA